MKYERGYNESKIRPVTDDKGRITGYIKGASPNDLMKDIIHLEILPCGHQNNLKLKDRQSGVCPKGDYP